VVDPATLRKALWPALAALAVGFLVLFSQHGERPEPGLQELTPSGLLAGVADNEILAIDVVAGDQRLGLRPGAGGVWSGPGGTLSPAQRHKLDVALRILRNAAVERTLDAPAGAPLEQYGLARPNLSLVVSMAAGWRLAIVFGAANPLGHSVYARVEGRDGILLMPSHVADSWREIVAP
jgi:hypothetical protein